MPAKRSLPGLPFAGTVADSLEMMRKVWGMTGLPAVPGTAQAAQFVAGLPGALPSMITPTLDVEELDKRIADLRAVEQWLNLNTQLLRTSIQTLEVQRNTIATLKSIGGSMLGGIRGGAPLAEPDAGLGAFGLGAAMPGLVAAAGTAAGAGSAATPAAPARTPAEAFRAEIARPRPGPARKRTAKSAAKSKAAPAIAGAPLNPAAWWNTLQDQFSKVAAAAAAGAEAGKRASAASEAARAQRAAGTPSRSTASTPAAGQPAASRTPRPARSTRATRTEPAPAEAPRGRARRG